MEEKRHIAYPKSLPPDAEIRYTLLEKPYSDPLLG
jgi:hypothetical protein